MPRRIRSVVLTPELVQSIAKSKGINSQTELNIAVLAIRADQEGRTTKAGDKAWRGDPLSRDCANDVARALGLDSYQDLQVRDGISLWSQLRMDESRAKDIIEVQLKSEIERRDLFTLEDETFEDDWQISINEPWRLRLSYLPGYHVLALIRSKDKHTVIVPSAYNFPSFFEQRILYIPSETRWLKFEQEKFGDDLEWREIIVIACRDDIFSVRQPSDDRCIDSASLDKIAAQLMSDTLRDHYVIDSKVFGLKKDR